MNNIILTKIALGEIFHEGDVFLQKPGKHINRENKFDSMKELQSELLGLGSELKGRFCWHYATDRLEI